CPHHVFFLGGFLFSRVVFGEVWVSVEEWEERHCALSCGQLGATVPTELEEAVTSELQRGGERSEGVGCQVGKVDDDTPRPTALKPSVDWPPARLTLPRYWFPQELSSQ
ncbi:hypothetical protein Pcinc_036522, partial [Petrolisthes cinctipes]